VNGAGIWKSVWPAALLVVCLIAAWQVAADTGLLADLLGLDSFLVPAPSEIGRSLYEDRSLLADNALVTFEEVLAGFAAALLLGIGTAVVLHLSPFVKRVSYPIVVASQTIPVIVIAPILVVWFGFGIGPKVAIIALICFFPVAVNTLDGLGTTPPEQRKLLRSLGAGRLRVLTMLEAPTALPFAISGAKIAAAVAVIGAVFGEWAGANEGLGHLMLVDNAQLEVPRLFAAMVWLSAMAILLFALLTLIERRIAWWGESPDEPTPTTEGTTT
jgi:ABC-type nitrate/sulfonate/bicarbonate transport system permease component